MGPFGPVFVLRNTCQVVKFGLLRKLSFLKENSVQILLPGLIYFNI